MCAGSTKIAAPIVILKMAAASPRMPMTRRRPGSVGAGEVMNPRYRKAGASLRARAFAFSSFPSLGKASACHPKDLLFGAAAASPSYERKSLRRGIRGLLVGGVFTLTSSTMRAIFCLVVMLGLAATGSAQEKPRVVVTTDPELDDANSLI